MKFLVALGLAAALAVVHAGGDHYDTKYENINVEEITENPRLLDAYLHCFLGEGKCTPEGTDIKKWIPEAVQSKCGKCTEKQKVLVAKFIKALKEKHPEGWEKLYKTYDPEGKHLNQLKEFQEKYL